MHPGTQSRSSSPRRHKYHTRRECHQHSTRMMELAQTLAGALSVALAHRLPPFGTVLRALALPMAQASHWLRGSLDYLALETARASQRHVLLGATGWRFGNSGTLARRWLDACGVPAHLISADLRMGMFCLRLAAASRRGASDNVVWRIVPPEHRSRRWKMQPVRVLPSSGGCQGRRPSI